MTTPAESGPAGQNLYVYGIVRADASVNLDAAPSVEDGAGVVLVARGGLAALVSRVSATLFARATDGDLGWLEEPVRAHEAVLEHALAAGPVVPMRFGSVVADADALRAYLDEHAERFAAALCDLDGRREWGVKAVVDEASLRLRLAAGSAPDDARSEGAAYLARKRVERQAEEALGTALEGIAARVHARLQEEADRTALVSGTLARPDAGRRVVLNAAYLVRQEREDAFRAAVEEVGAETAASATELALTGPWPPYSFVDEVGA